MKNESGLLAGSFDPPTLGHLDIIQRAAPLCHHLFIGIAENSKKNHPAFSILERQAMLAELCHSLPNVKIVVIPGLVVEYAKHHNIDFLIRGLRSVQDFEFEMQMAIANKKLCGVETLFLMADSSHAHISSTLINEIALGGYRLHDFVPEVIEDAVYTRITLKK
jgi:pantetheine-phosphate adenylyltransferase